MVNPEILAPAGSMEALKAAVYCKADAVYLGGKEFNARRNADNFSFEQLKDAVKFCHERDVKVYETLNILMLPNEEEQLLRAVEQAALSQVDALIIQDIGVLSIVKRVCPDMKCHASTQMSIHNLDGVRRAAAMGMDLAVLARELSAEEIAYITKNSPIPTEVFVHGALCMCVSGQCYLSSMIGERSGNRGLCAQPCRLPFSIGSKDHALSLKDMSLVEKALEFKRLGVSSLKIEGRMKRPEYVAASVSALRAALDGKRPDMSSLQKVFSRSGFTDGYYMGHIDSSMFGIREKEDVLSANEVLRELSPLCLKETPLAGLKGEFYAHEGEKLVFKAEDMRGNRVQSTAPAPEKAVNAPTDGERVLSNLNKTGGTPYYFEDISLDMESDLMIKASTLNLLRREAIEKLGEKRREITPLEFKRCLPKFDEACPFKEQEIRVRCFKEQLTPFVSENAHRLILPLDSLEKALSLGCKKEKIIAEIPRIDFIGREKVRGLLDKAKKLGIEDVWAGNIGSIQIAQELDMRIHAGFSLNAANCYAADALSSMGAVDTEMSIEMNLNLIKGINNVNKGIIAYGSLPLMTFRNCPAKAFKGCDNCKQNSFLQDRRKVKFPISCKSGTAELLNSVPIYLADRQKELAFLDFLTLYFTLEKPFEVEKILREYTGELAPKLQEKGYTRGLYYRRIK